MNSKQKNIFWSINLFAFVFLMYFITQVTKAYIAADYPEISDTMIANLLTIPNLVGLVFSFLIGPVALKHSKRKLTAVSLACVIIYCAAFYFTGLLHLPFWMLIVGCFFAGCSQGTYAPLLNSMIADHFPAEQRGNRIANYNVAINIGTLIILQLSGIIASANDGANWYNAYLLGQYAFNINVSTFIVSEYELGSSVQVGTATSLVRFSLVIFTALYPVLNRTFKNWMIPLGYLCVAAGLLIMMQTKSLTGAYVCACFIGLATSLAHSTLYAKASRFVSAALVPVAMSLVWGVANIGSSFAVYALKGISALMGGGMSNSFLAGVIVSVIAAVIAVYMYVIKKPVEDVER